MKEFVCKKCGSLELFIKPNGEQTGLYCSDCGKWLSKAEIPLAERFIEANKPIKNETPVSTTKEERLEEICKIVSDFLFENYDPHTTVIITDTHIKVVQDIRGIPVKRWDK